MDIITEIQNKIEPFASQYYKKYRAEELCYWYHVAEWMIQDAKENKNNVDKVLDIGSGHGTLSVLAKTIYNCDVISVDVLDYITKSMIKHFDLNYILLDVEVDMEEIEFYNYYDRIIFTEVLEHLYCNPIPTLTKFNKMLKDNGLMFLSTPDSIEWGCLDTFYTHPNQMPNPEDIKKPDFNTINQHIYQYNQEEVKKLIDESGFKINKFSLCKIGERPRHLNYELKKAGEEL